LTLNLNNDYLYLKSHYELLAAIRVSISFYILLKIYYKVANTLLPHKRRRTFGDVTVNLLIKIQAYKIFIF